MEKSPSALLNNQKGMATVETVVLMVLFISLVYYSFGFFGIVHTGVLNNIHARTYAFETFRHRANVRYFRSNRPNDIHFYNQASRLHGINSEAGQGNSQFATERPISMGFILEEDNRRTAVHNEDISARVSFGERNANIGVNPVWIMVMYGLCFDETCGRP